MTEYPFWSQQLSRQDSRLWLKTWQTITKVATKYLLSPDKFFSAVIITYERQALNRMES